MKLPASFLTRPLTHRGLHDHAQGVIENSRTAFDAAIAQGFGIELDVQISADGVPVVFHDPDLDRLTDARGPVNARTAASLGQLTLDGGADTIQPLATVLSQIAGRVPVLVEIKDQTGLDCAHDLEQAVGHVVAAHDGPVAVMSFNPAYIAGLSWLDNVPRGITSTSADDYPDTLPAATRMALARLDGFEGSGASFISHNHLDLENSRVAALRASGIPVLCWTIRSQAQADAALRLADNITFEGFTPG